MSKVFSARFEILGNGLSQPGIFQVFANAIDPTLAGYSVTDIIVGDVFFDENIMTGDTNRYRVTQIFGTGSSSFQGAGPISIRLLAAWDDDGDFDPAGPAAGTGYISRATVHGRLAEVPAWTIFGISEPLAARVASINGRVGIAPRIGASAISKIMVSGSFDPIPTGTPVSKRVDGKIVPADSDSSTGQIYVGVVKETIAPLASGTVLLIGQNVAGVLSGLGITVGKSIYLSENGGFTSDPNSFTGVNDSIIRVGFADCEAGIASGVATDLIMLPQIMLRP